MAMEEIHAIEEMHPGIKGTLQVTASGQVELQPATKAGYRIDELHADIAAKGVQLEGQPLGDAHLTASSQGLALRAHLDSTVAGTVVKGDGEWRLDGDYPGSATRDFLAGGPGALEALAGKRRAEAGGAHSQAPWKACCTSTVRRWTGGR